MNKNLIFWLLICAVIGLGIYLVFYIQTESYQCISNPYQYGLKLLHKANDAPISCLCSVNKIAGAQFSMTEEGIQSLNNKELNISINSSGQYFKE